MELTYKEFELLKLLFSRRGVALTRDEILQAVWDYDYTGETRTVELQWLPEYTTFSSIDRRHIEY